jgi:hypothetical protein
MSLQATHQCMDVHCAVAVSLQVKSMVNGTLESHILFTIG